MNNFFGVDQTAVSEGRGKFGTYIHEIGHALGSAADPRLTAKARRYPAGSQRAITFRSITNISAADALEPEPAEILHVVIRRE